ncbi:UNVERIFIED_CONTAM: hypothetical protein PYX00_008603 [Menopon gallinae]|uniref:Uncharacterized protein n=1 Tax=Menopon gallinae TaxID=328185 RepID=A0AAW2HQ21_9NEOP
MAVYFDRSVRKLRKEIATFLHLERIEYLKGKDKIFYSWDVDPWSIGWGENQDNDTDPPQNSDTGQQEPKYEFGRNIKDVCN